MMLLFITINKQKYHGIKMTTVLLRFLNCSHGIEALPLPQWCSCCGIRWPLNVTVLNQTEASTIGFSKRRKTSSAATIFLFLLMNK